jgi:RNA polymerase sigma factor (sigma-70 family)
MKNWRKLKNYRKVKNPDGSITYTITVYGQDIEVSEEIYTSYASMGRKMEYMEYDLKHDRVQKDSRGNTIYDANGLPTTLPEREVSLDRLLDEDWDFASKELPPDIAVVNSMDVEMLHTAINLCSDEERDLIDALYVRGLTIREYADQTGLSKSRVDRSKAKTLARLKKLLVG